QVDRRETNMRRQVTLANNTRFLILELMEPIPTDMDVHMSYNIKHIAPAADGGEEKELLISEIRRVGRLCGLCWGAATGWVMEFEEGNVDIPETVLKLQSLSLGQHQGSTVLKSCII